MSDPGALSLALLQQHNSRPTDPKELESLGKCAAEKYAQCGMDLSDAVVETVKEAHLSPEQVKRVCEFANTSAYLSEFEKAGEVRNITFDGGPADPGVVLRSLNDGSAPAIHQTGSPDYEPPAGSYKTASADGEAMLAGMFGVEGMEKAASVDHHQHADPMEDVYDMKTRLDGMRDDFMSKLSSSNELLATVKQDLGDAALQTMDDGYTLGDVANAWSSYASSSSILKEAMVIVGARLRERGSSENELTQSLVKQAHAGRLPNPDHPLIKHFVAFSKIAHEHGKLEEAIKVVDEQRTPVNEQLQRMLG